MADTCSDCGTSTWVSAIREQQGGAIARGDAVSRAGYGRRRGQLFANDAWVTRRIINGSSLLRIIRGSMMRNSSALTMSPWRRFRWALRSGSCPRPGCRTSAQAPSVPSSLNLRVSAALPWNKRSGERQRPGTLVTWSTSGAGPWAKPKAPAVGHFLVPG